MKQILFVLLLGLALSCQKSKENTENQEKPDSAAFTNETECFLR